MNASLARVLQIRVNLLLREQTRSAPVAVKGEVKGDRTVPRIGRDPRRR